MKKLLLILSTLLLCLNLFAYKEVWPSDVKYNISLNSATAGINIITGEQAATFTSGSTFDSDVDGDYFFYKSGKGGLITYTATTEILASDVYTVQMKVKVKTPIGGLCCPAVGGMTPLTFYDGGFGVRMGFSEGSTDYGEGQFYCGYPPSAIQTNDAILFDQIQTVQMVFRKNIDGDGYLQKIYYITRGMSAKYTWGAVNPNAVSGFNPKHWQIGGYTFNDGLTDIKIYEMIIAIGKDYNGQEITSTLVPEMVIVSPNGSGPKVNNGVAFYDFEQNVNDVLNGYTLSLNNTGPVYQTDQVKSGSYSYSVQNNEHYAYFPPALVTHLGTLPQWNIGGWMYVPEGTAGNWGMLISSNWTNFTVAVKQNATTMEYYLIYDGVEVSGSFLDAPNKFKYVSVQWDGAQVKLFIDGVLRATKNDTDNVFQKTTIYPYAVNRAIYANNQGAYRVDKMVISSVVMNGVENEPIDVVGSKYQNLNQIKYGDRIW